MTVGNHGPSLALFVSEPLRAVGDAWSHIASRRVARAPRNEDSHSVVLFPGLATDGLSLWPLRRYLNGLGYRALDWGKGINTGPTGDLDLWLATLKHSVLAQVDLDPARPQPISLVGWSLGGLYARELAKLMPGRVQRVITIGTPFNGHAGQTNVGWLYRLLNRKGPADSPQLRARLARPPPVPTTSIYSRHDGVVSWQACRHDRRYGASVKDIEVSASHLGMGLSRVVMDVVGRELATAHATTNGVRAWNS